MISLGNRPAVFVSDVHLGLSPETDARFARFLENLPREIVFFSLGDLVDVWSEGSNYDLSDLYPVLENFKGRTSYFVKGNRDFLIGPRWEAATGGKVLGDRAEIGVCDRTIVILHGDTLITNDARYRLWRKIARSSVFASFAGIIGRRGVTRAAATLRKGSEQEVRRKTSRTLELDLAAAIREKGSHDFLVCGHTHRPEFRKGSGVITLGAWDRSAEVLFVDGDGVRLENA